MTIKEEFENRVIYCPVCKFHVKPEVSESSDKEHTTLYCKDCNTVFARIKKEKNA